ncbi:MAG TPA: hypothetical protein VGU63_14995 [Candidatus Acidoferrales bacterium]|nr:hypothetical protein [Candidatus Acidoferrales bacterium]
MQKPRGLGILPFSLCLLIWAAGCSHAIFPTQGGGGGGGGTKAPVILTFHDSTTAPAGISVTSFEATVTGALLQPGSVSILSAPQTIELTQLQANSAFLSTTQVATGSYTSLVITYANPKYTFLNDSGVQVTANGQTCAAGASCVVTPTITGASTVTLSGAAPFPIVTTTNQTTLLAVDLDLNSTIQSDFSVSFTNSTSVAAVQSTGATGTTVGNFAVTGAVTSVGSNQFSLASSTGQTLTVAVSSSTAFQFQRANCTANDFTCLAVGQILNVDMSNLTTTGALQATEVDFDDAASTQQVTGTIVSFNATPPTSFQMIMHNAVPSISGLSVGTPVTVNIANTATFAINNGSLPLPVGETFATSSDLLVGQEVEARISGTFTPGPPPSFTTDRIALEPTQLTATVASVSPSTSILTLNQLPVIFVDNPIGSVSQIQVTTVSPGTLFLNLSPASLSGVTAGQTVSVGGFLFNTISTSGSPTIVADAVVGP